MKKIKYFNKYFKDKTDKQLINEALGLDQMIHQVGCFGVRDMIRFNAIDTELAQRGYESVDHKEYFKQG